MVEEWDTDNFAAMSGSDKSNINVSWHVPPTHTKTCYHTGVYIDRDKINKQWADQYFGSERNSSIITTIVSAPLDDTVLPNADMNGDELREACRALKGHILRSEVYSEDGTEKAGIPYRVTESNYTLVAIQPLQDANQHSVFMVHDRESLKFNYEKVADDPNIHHKLVLEADAFGNVLQWIQIAYARQLGAKQLTRCHRHVQAEYNTLSLF